jgi:hypothetical protein
MVLFRFNEFGMKNGLDTTSKSPDTEEKESIGASLKIRVIYPPKTDKIWGTTYPNLDSTCSIEFFEFYWTDGKRYTFAKDNKVLLLTDYKGPNGICGLNIEITGLTFGGYGNRVKGIIRYTNKNEQKHDCYTTSYTTKGTDVGSKEQQTQKFFLKVELPEKGGNKKTKRGNKKRHNKTAKRRRRV